MCHSFHFQYLQKTLLLKHIHKIFSRSYHFLQRTTLYNLPLKDTTINIKNTFFTKMMICFCNLISFMIHSYLILLLSKVEIRSSRRVSSTKIQRSLDHLIKMKSALFQKCLFLMLLNCVQSVMFHSLS